MAYRTIAVKGQPVEVEYTKNNVVKSDEPYKREFDIIYNKVSHHVLCDESTNFLYLMDGIKYSSEKECITAIYLNSLTKVSTKNETDYPEPAKFEEPATPHTEPKRSTDRTFTNKFVIGDACMVHVPNHDFDSIVGVVEKIDSGMYKLRFDWRRDWFFESELELRPRRTGVITSSTQSL